MKPKIILSLGAGVQSSTLALLAEHGVVEKPDMAIFADVGDEPQEVYDWLDWLETQLSYPVKRVSYNGRRLSDDVGALRPTGKFRKMPIPAWIKLNKDGVERSGGLLRRQCTTDYKIRPLIKQARIECGIFNKKTPDEILVHQWIGISLDEIQRMKPSREKFIEHKWPLIEMDWTRQHCLDWFKKNYNVHPPRSACTFCPFHDNKEWRHIRDNYPEDWQKSIEMDNDIRNIWASQENPGTFYLHRDRVPLSEANIDDDYDDQLDMFTNECEGMCGV